ncbi:MAG: hypothetical protein Q8O41_10890 [Candidatus Methanoperedens sp.]|nr:hypothetical protein [Candidatus Methanoperedens sp.]
MNKEKDSGLKLIRTMSEKEKEKFCKFQMEAIRRSLKKSQRWKDTALQRVGDIVVW